MGAKYAVQLIVPAEAGSARLARLVAAGVAADANFTLDDTEDLRVAVSELVALLVEGAENTDEHLTLTYQRSEDAVEVSGERLMPSGAAGVSDDGSTPDDLALEILRVVVDQHRYEHDESGRHFHLVKRARASA
jgi:anti-sigma regulatory factor (Ser/Thr protein kinase)